VEHIDHEVPISSRCLSLCGVKRSSAACKVSNPVIVEAKNLIVLRNTVALCGDPNSPVKPAVGV
jgi:hypothetical protein